MKLGLVLGTLAGVLLAGLLVWQSGIAGIATALRTAGWAIVPVVLFHVVQLLASALAWRAIAAGLHARIGFGALLRLRWIREGVNNLLPSAQIGGELVAARLMRKHGAELGPALAGVTADLTMEMLTQILFTLFCVALLLLSLGAPGLQDEAVRAVLGTLAVALLAAAGFLGAQLGGGALLVERLLERLAARFGWAAGGELAGLHASLRAVWRRPRGVARSAFWHGVSWLLGGIEVWLALRALGHPVTLSAATAIEGIGQALKSAGFAVPGAIGVQEGGYVLVCGFYGVPADAAIALSLVKRLRELAFGVPSLVAWREAERRGGRGATGDKLRLGAAR